MATLPEMTTVRFVRVRDSVSFSWRFFLFHLVDELAEAEHLLPAAAIFHLLDGGVEAVLPAGIESDGEGFFPLADDLFDHADAELLGSVVPG